MGPFQEYKVKKLLGKDSTRSRIPRLKIQHFHPKDPQLSESPLSEDESKESDISIKQNRTISPNSFSSDDTGCPSSQFPSPVKISSGNSSFESSIAVQGKAKVKRVRVNAVAECHGIIQAQKREQQQSLILHRGSEADFSSISSTGSFKSRGTMANSTGKKSCLSHSQWSQIRSQPVFKPPGSPSGPRDAELYAPYRTPPKKTHSSPTMRRTTPGSYHSCNDNHGIRPPNPEQYLTPLQQKEVTIRHLRTKLRDSEQTISDRESEIQELKSQLERMREDWIEEECHRVEAQLALKEARKEIKQLRQVVETMKNSLMEKDKGIQKYFIDINIQNRKLESLLHSMEVAQSGSNLHDEPTLDFICVSPEKSSEEKEKVENLAEDEMADSGLLVNDMINQMDMIEQVLMSTAVDCSQDGIKLLSQPGLSTLLQSAAEDSEKSSKDQIHSRPTPYEQHTLGEKAVQTDETSYNPDLQALLLHLLRLQNSGLSSDVLQKLTKAQKSNVPQATKNELSQAENPSLIEEMDLIPFNPAFSTFLVPQDPVGSTQSSGPDVDTGFIEEQDFDMKDACSSSTIAVMRKSHWSNSFLVSLVSVAAPVVPTLAWLCSQHNAADEAPVYNISSLIRSCCVMGLHSLRLVTYGPHV